MDAHLEDAPIFSSQTDVSRPTANYHPSVGGDYLLTCGSDSDLTKVDALEEEEHQQLKEEVKKMLMQVPAKSLQKLELIDSIQRLGVDYHFEEEIEASLKYTFDAYEVCIEEDGNDDLYTVALHFRLLRQHGYRVSCHVFDKFKDPDGKFKDSLTSNVAGILALYEAAYFLVHGEDILEEAITFTTSHLELIVPKLTNSMAKQVVEALKLPIQKSWSRLSVKEYISIYEEDHRTQSNYELLLKFAKLDFNILQKMHQRELSGITRWWKGLDFTKKLPFARDRLVECYFWMLGVYFEPQYALVRKFLTKVIAMTSVLDDIYYAYGTFDELKLFTDVIESWDISAIDQLPSYMQLFYRALLDVYSETEEELAKEGRSYGIHFAKTEMAKLARAYFEEAKWLYNNYIPTFEEYMKVALVSGAITMLATSSFLGMGEILNKEAFVWVTSKPSMARAISVLGRLLDDMMSHEFEQQRRHVPSAVECYMKQYGTSKQEAFDELQKQVANAWKEVNAECLLPTAVPMPLLMRAVNLVRITNVIYLVDDAYTSSETRFKDLITSILVTNTVTTKE